MHKKIRKIVYYLKLAPRYIIVWARFLFGLGKLPDYLVIGVQKGGTTAVQKYLAEHPDISRTLIKEVYYFDKNYKKGTRWYAAHFPSTQKVVGEATPYYIYHPLVAKRVVKTLANVRLIVLLRNPVDRAFSHYKMEFNRGDETRTFAEAISAEEEELKGERKKVASGSYSWKHQHHSYLDRGKYVQQLEIWFRYFDKKNILVIKSEDLRDHTQKELSKIFKFLNLKDYKVKNTKKYHLAKGSMKMDGKSKKYLQSYFRAYNKKLYRLLGRDFRWE